MRPAMPHLTVGGPTTMNPATFTPVLLAQSVEDFGGWASILGVPGAILLAFLFAGHRGWIRWGREVERETKERIDREAEWNKRYTELDEDWAARYAATEKTWAERYATLERDKDRWLELALQQAPALQRAVDLAKTVTGKTGT